MTREERIDWLCRLRADLNNGIIFTPWNKEFTEALTGILEQEPYEDWCDVPSDEMTLEQARQAVKDLRKKLAKYLWQQSCEDAISRDAVLKQLKGCLTGGETEYKYVKMHIDSIPPVKPQKPMTEKVIKMRDATPEERESIAKYIKSISKPTGISFETPEQEPLEVESTKLQQTYNKGFEDCRQAVLDTISELNAISFYEAQEDSKECYYEIRQAVENMSPVTPQPKDGKWIDYRNDGFVECPFCGHATNCEDNIDELHYCFYCGAKMVEPKESEDKNEQNKISG